MIWENVWGCTLKKMTFELWPGKNEAGMYILEGQAFPRGTGRKFGVKQTQQAWGEKNLQCKCKQMNKDQGGMNSEVWTHQAHIPSRTRSLGCILQGMRRQWEVLCRCIMWSEVSQWGTWLLYAGCFGEQGLRQGGCLWDSVAAKDKTQKKSWIRT